MAKLGVARFDELVGRVDLLDLDDAVAEWRARGIDLSAVLEPAGDGPRRRTEAPPPTLDDGLGRRLLELAQPAIEHGEPLVATARIANTDRTVGGLLSHAVTAAHGAAGLPEGTIRLTLRGAAGQSFGAWLAPGIELTLVGEANDYVGKGLSGGVIAVRPPEDATFAPEENTIVGNTVLYGATRGRAFLRGLAGERFAVRNSGALAVVEGLGDHGCEYMTGGVVVVLGPTGRNFAAGMSGGVAYVLDASRDFETRCNRELVGLETVEDDEELRELVAEHLARTGSAVAARLLADWEPSRFLKVMPHDYRRVLELAAVSTGGEGFYTTESEEALA